MKKIIALSLALVMALALFTGCSDPVADEFTNYMNVEMVDVNANYTKITEEVSNWQNLADDAALKKSIEEVLLPLVEDSLAKVNAIVLETEEVNNIRAKYVSVMEAYKAGFAAIAASIPNADQAKYAEGEAKLTEGIALLEEYNAALEELAASIGAEIQY